MKISKTTLRKAKEKTNVAGLLVFEFREADGLLDDFITDCIGYCSNYDDLEDMVHEYSDGLVDIYYNDIYESTNKFSEAIDEATKDFGRPETIEKEIQQGQYYAYFNLFNSFVNNLRTLDTDNE
jgi:hypothetical protein